MTSMNKVQLIGNLGSEPEIRSFQNGGRVAHFSFATTEKWKDKDGKRQEKTEWHRVVVYNDGLIKIIEKYIKKGHRCYIEGRIETRKYTDKDGEEKYTAEIVLRPYNGEILMLEQRKAA